MAIMLFERWYGLEKKRVTAADNAILAIYRTIRENRVITASDLVTLYETASLCKGELTMITGCDRETVDPETGCLYSYREYLFFDDIREIIENEGRFELQPGDSVSLRIETAPKNLVGVIYRARSRIFAGGLV